MPGGDEDRDGNVTSFLFVMHGIETIFLNYKNPQPKL